MRLYTALRLFHYLSLALASWSLVVVMEAFLPEIYLYLFPVPLLFLAVFFVGEGWSMPNWAANLPGAALLFVGLRLLWRNWSAPERQLSLPTAVIPYAGVALVLLTPLFALQSRGLKYFWRLQGVGVVQVAIACTMAGPAIFGYVFFAYLATALTALRLRQQLGDDMAVTGRQYGTGAVDVAPLVGSCLGWAIVVAGLGISLSLVTPKPRSFLWDPYANFGGRRMDPLQAQTGFDEEIDLSQTGEVELNDEVAFNVKVADANGWPKEDLPDEQRWRGGVLDSYEHGKWKSLYRSYPIPGLGRLDRLASQLPDFGPRQLFFTFRVSVANAGGLFLAEPIRIGAGNSQMPVIPLAPVPRNDQLFIEFQGTVVPVGSSSRPEVQYLQAVPPAREPERTPCGLLDARYLRSVKSKPVPDLDLWTRELLDRLVQQGQLGLARTDLEGDAIKIKNPTGVIPAAAEKIARAFCNHLANSGEYRYTLDLRRDDPALDPAMDFLRNVKEGHCERYATALALMCRAQGIPSRIVKGFRGHDSNGPGKYVVRHSHAHSWVEVLVPRILPDGKTELDWLALDPTPFTDAPKRQGPSLLAVLLDSLRNFELIWRTMFLDYGKAQQALLLEFLWSRSVLVSAMVGVVLIWLGLRLRHASPARLPLPFFARLVSVLTQHGFAPPAPAQTPSEYAGAAGDFLRSTPAAALAGFPSEAAQLLYRARFGAQPLQPVEEQSVRARLRELATLLGNTKKGPAIRQTVPVANRPEPAT